MKTLMNLRGRSLLKLDDLTEEEVIGLLDLAQELKTKRKQGLRGDLLAGKHIALVFEKMSTRTRCAAMVAVADEGGTAEYLSADDIHLGHKESVADTARVLGRMFHGLLFRGFKQSTVELLARRSGIPVWNGLTDDAHPTQALADLMTVRERFGRLKGLRVVYVGDGRNNVCNSLMVGCSKTGMHFVNCAPPELSPREDLVERARRTAERNGGSVTVAIDPQSGVRGGNVVYTDVWASMGEESKFQERVRLLRPYQVNMDMMRRTGNVDNGTAIFLHCLPAFHDHNTTLTKDIGPLEVTDEVFEAGFSLVFDQAENRLHTMKALFVATLANA